MKVTVFGSTGMLGKPVVIELVNAGFEVTALVKSIEKARLELPARIKLIQGDLSNVSDIEKAIEGAEGVYLNLSVLPSSKRKDFQPEREGIRNIIQATQKSQVKFIGYCSSLVKNYQGMNGFNWWVFDIKNKAVENIKNSGIPYIIFYPSTFMENYDKGGYKQGKRINLAGKSEHPMYFIAGRDYGRQVSQAFRKFDGTSKEYIVQGPEGYTAEQAAKIFIENYRPQKLSVARLPMGILKFLGNFTTTFNYVAHIVEALNKYPETFGAENTWKDLGKPETTLKEYASKIN